MKTLLTKPKMAAVLTAAIGLALSGQASASVYARSYLQLTNFTVVFAPVTSGGATSFSFDLTNTARLNNVNVANGIAGCGGSPLDNDCGVAPVLNAPANNAPGSDAAAIRGDADFAFKGPGVLQYANSASIIDTAELVNGTPSSTRQISESELQTGTSAGSSSEISSQTNLSLVFDVITPGALTISWTALLDMLAQSTDAGAITDQADSSFTFVLSQITGGAGEWGWSSNGVQDNTDCTGNLGCTETDPFDLNGGVAVAGIGTDSFLDTADFSAGTSALLTTGTYALTLTAQTTTSIRRVPVPEPSALLLLGAGLLGAGFKKRHNIAKLVA